MAAYGSPFRPKMASLILPLKRFWCDYQNYPAENTFW